MVQGIGQGLHVDIQSGKHSITSGLSVSNGGQDEAPSPHALLEAALTACTILTLELYAKRKEWNLGKVSCEVRIEEEGAQGTRFARTISFSESLSADVLERLETIANKCPVHRILTGSVTIDTKVVG